MFDTLAVAQQLVRNGGRPSRSHHHERHDGMELLWGEVVDHDPASGQRETCYSPPTRTRQAEEAPREGL